MVDDCWIPTNLSATDMGAWTQNASKTPLGSYATKRSAFDAILWRIPSQPKARAYSHQKKNTVISTHGRCWLVISSRWNTWGWKTWVIGTHLFPFLGILKTHIWNHQAHVLSLKLQIIAGLIRFCGHFSQSKHHLFDRPIHILDINC
jgi:hypothetical protein